MQSHSKFGARMSFCSYLNYLNCELGTKLESHGDLYMLNVNDLLKTRNVKNAFSLTKDVVEI